MSAEVKERLKRMPVHDHGPFSVGPLFNKSKSFKTIGDTNGWFAVINNKGEYIDADGRATFTENDARWVADALNFYMKSKLLDGNYIIR